jgi:hypothetical protein
MPNKKINTIDGHRLTDRERAALDNWGVFLVGKMRNYTSHQHGSSLLDGTFITMKVGETGWCDLSIRQVSPGRNGLRITVAGFTDSGVGMRAEIVRTWHTPTGGRIADLDFDPNQCAVDRIDEIAEMLRMFRVIADVVFEFDPLEASSQ